MTTPNSMRQTFEALAGQTPGQRRNRSGIVSTTLAVTLLLLIMAGLSYLMVSEDQHRQRDRLHKTTDVLADALEVRLQATAESVQGLTQALITDKDDAPALRAAARQMMGRRNSVLEVTFVDPTLRVRWAVASPNPLGTVGTPVGQQVTEAATIEALQRAERIDSAFYSRPYSTTAEGSPFVDLIVPVLLDGRNEGAVVASISLHVLLRDSVAPETARRYRFSLLEGDQVLASTSGTPTPADAQAYDVRALPLPDSVVLRAVPYQLDSALPSNALIWVIGGLALVLLVTLISLARHDARQNRVDRQLRAETAVRRAMEDSLATGLRVLDSEGRILYVNRAFCRMTGFAAGELIGRLPPYPYWPDEEDQQRLTQLVGSVIEGTATAGYELNIRRKDGSSFAAQMHVSPLIADDGEQLGWVTSMAG